MLGTTAAWVIFDAAWFARRETPEYRQWARRFSLKLYTVAIVCFAAVGTWYVFLTWTPEVRKAMFAWPWLPLTLATAAAMGLPWLLIYRLQKRAEVGRGLASLLGLVQFAVLGVNAVSRQVVQNLELARYSFDITKQPEAVQWSPLVFFLAVFVLGLAVVSWMIYQVAKLPAEAEGKGQYDHSRYYETLRGLRHLCSNGRFKQVAIRMCSARLRRQGDCVLSATRR